MPENQNETTAVIEDAPSVPVTDAAAEAPVAAAPAAEQEQVLGGTAARVYRLAD